MDDALTRLGQAGVVVATEIRRVEDTVAVCQAILDGGVDCLEVTFRTAAAAGCIEAARNRFPGLVVGAGTVLTTGQVDSAIAAGASFLVSPSFNPEVAAHAKARGVPFVPGVATPSEVDAAIRHGFDVLKFFPAEVLGGVHFLNAVRGPYPTARFMPTGGITENNLSTYLSLSNVFSCGGSWIAPPSDIQERNFSAITRRARAATAIVAEVRSGAMSGARV